MTREYKIPVKAELLPDTAVKVDTGLNTRLATAGPHMATMGAEIESLMNPQKVIS